MWSFGSTKFVFNSLPNPSVGSSIPFPGVKCLSVSEGKLHVGTARSLYRFTPISLENQVQV